jgi:hypothetical protein
VIALVPLIEPLALTWPFHPGDPGWRFLLVTGLIGHGAALLAGLVVAFVAALLLDDRLTLRRLGFTALILGALLLLLAVVLLVQLLLVQGDIDPGLRVADFGVTRRVIEGILLGLAFLGLGLGARRTLSALPERTSGSRRTSDRIAGM